MGGLSTRFPLYLQTLVAMVAGAILGIALGEKTAPLGMIAKYIVEVVKWIAIPLLFFSIIETISNAEIKGRSVLHMFFISACNGLAAILIALAISNLFKPGKYLVVENLQSEPPRLVSYSSSRIIPLFIQSPMMLAILFAVLMGILLWTLKTKTTLNMKSIDRVASGALQLTIRVIGIAVLALPVAVFCAVAKVVGQHGFALVGGLASYLLSTIGGMCLQVLLVYHTWISRAGQIPIRLFWKHAKEPAVHSFGVNSSLATLPLTLRALSKLGVSEGSARLAACIGTNLNNDGILLYEVVAVLFLTQAQGIELDLIHQLITCGICLMATLGVSGVPEAGVIALSLVVTAVGLPIENIAYLLTVDWFVARCRSVTNVVSDMTVSIGIDALKSRPHFLLAGARG